MSSSVSSVATTTTPAAAGASSAARLLLLLLTLLLPRHATRVAAQSSSTICTTDNNEFHVRVNLHAGEFGYLSFEECDTGDDPNGTPHPTIGIEVGQTYTFIQADKTNYFHPLGFAYFPDGAHDGKDELEPIVSLGSSGCDATGTCPAPMYHATGLGGYLGKYSNDADVAPLTTNETDFGLDAYEPLFYYPMREWLGFGTFSIKLKFDDDTFDKDLFYFCHIHQFMSGRIKLLKNGVPINDADDPALGYEYDSPGTFDQTCGTYGLDAFQLPHPQCLDTYVCGIDDASSSSLQSYATCTNAMNCHMFAGMTTGVKAASTTALFIHQMIPHHQNAVNMAKSLLHSGALACDDLLNEDDALCNMEVLMMEIINSQNFQIHVMRNVLKSEGYPLEDKCVVEITSSTVE